MPWFLASLVYLNSALHMKLSGSGVGLVVKYWSHILFVGHVEELFSEMYVYFSLSLSLACIKRDPT